MTRRPYSILLPLDGSIYSRNAANLAWKLAKVNGANVTAQHVVDSVGASEFLGPNVPGFLPTNPYHVTHEHICQGLRVMSRILQENYRDAASKEGVKSAYCNDEGDPVAEICKRAAAHDLVVIGHRRQQTNQPDTELRQIHRLSIAESLAHRCPRPLLIVQEKPVSWKTMTIMFSMDHVNENYIEACLKLAKLFGISPELLCFSSGYEEESPADFVKNLRLADHSVVDVPIKVTTLRELCLPPEGSKVGTAQLNPGFRNWTECLPVMPTREVVGQRLTVLHESPALFVRSLSVPTMLLVPEEYVSANSFTTDVESRTPLQA